MSDQDYDPPPRTATCEDVDEDSEEATNDAQKSANVTAKRAKPDVVKKASFERRRDNGTDSGYASRAPTVGSSTSSRKEKRNSGLKIDTSIQERERQPYHYSATVEKAQKPPNRPVIQRTDSKSTKSAAFHRHSKGECWICDQYGEHIDLPPPTSAPYPSPMAARYPPPTEQYATTQLVQAPPLVRRTSSYRASRPASMFVGTAAESPYQARALPSPFATESPSYTWHTTPTPLYSAVTPVTYASYPTTAVPQIYPPAETQTSYFHQPPPSPQSRPKESSRRASMHIHNDRPVVQQDTSQYRDGPRYEDRPPLRPQKSNRDRDYDNRAMPPPPPPKQSQVVFARRPSIKKATTSHLVTTEHRRSQSYNTDRGEHQSLEIRERKAEPSLPPSSYRGPSTPIHDRPVARKSTSYDSTKYSTNVASTNSAQLIARRRADSAVQSPLERYEAEAEAYQRKRGTSGTHDVSSHSLTAEALRKVPKVPPLTTRSETNSSQRSRNTSSKGSSAAKTGRSNSGTITVRMNGIALDIANSDNGQPVNITSKGVNISVGGNGRSSEKEYTMSSRASQAPSGTSKTSKTSRSSGKEREREIDRERERERDSRDGDGRRSSRMRNEGLPDRAGGRRSQSISRYFSRSDREEPLVYGA